MSYWQSMYQHLVTRPWLLNLALLNSLVGGLIISVNVPWAEIHGLAFAFVVISLVAQMLLLSLLCCLVIYLVSLVLRPLRIAIMPAIIALMIFSSGLLILLIDQQIFRLYRFHIDSMVLNLLFGGALFEILSFSFAMWLNIGLVVVMVVLLQFGLILVAACFRLIPPKKGRFVVIFAVLLLSLVHVSHAVADALGRIDITSRSRYVPWQSPLRARHEMAKLGLSIPEHPPRLALPDHANLNYPLAPIRCDLSGKPPNILLLVVDSLRADMLNPQVMPQMSVFANKSWRFNQHFSVGNATRAGIFGLLYGLPSTYWEMMLDAERGSVLFDATQQLNYQYFIYGSAPLYSPEFHRTAFSAIRQFLRTAPDGDIISKDTYIANQLIQDLQTRDRSKPFFGFLFFDAPHGYAVPDEEELLFQPMLPGINYLALNNDSDPLPFLNRYRGAAHFNDRLLGKILHYVEKQKLLDNTIVIVTSDHGQEANETKTNQWGHNGNFSHWETQVPMVVHWPRLPPRVINSMTSHLDVVPTLMQSGLNCIRNSEDVSTGINWFNTPPASRMIELRSSNQHALRTNNNRIYVFDEFGVLNTFDSEYRPLKEQIPTALLQQKLHNMQKFIRP